MAPKHPITQLDLNELPTTNPFSTLPPSLSENIQVKSNVMHSNYNQDIDPTLYQNQQMYPTQTSPIYKQQPQQPQPQYYPQPQQQYYPPPQPQYNNSIIHHLSNKIRRKQQV
jgi:hypothetical protein